LNCPAFNMGDRVSTKGVLTINRWVLHAIGVA